MGVHAAKVELGDILHLRALYLQETNFQIRYNACHERGWTDSYLITNDGAAIGYGSIKGQDREGRDAVFEFYIVPPFLTEARRAFRELLAASGAQHIECQSNDALLSSMLFDFAQNINSDTVLFADHTVTGLSVPGALFRRRKDDDRIFGHKTEPIGEYGVVLSGEVVAIGGFLLHYNPPFADLFMEVREDSRKKGIGSYLVQELKRECYLAGRVPAARCSIQNQASRATLIKAGLKVCGYMLMGDVKASARRS